MPVNLAATTAVPLANHTGAAVNVTNRGLVLVTTRGTGFSATGAGTFSIPGSGGTIDSSSGSGLFVQNTSIGASELSFNRISAGAGAGNGITLDHPGTTAGLTITGTGGANSGGV